MDTRMDSDLREDFSLGGGWAVHTRHCNRKPTFRKLEAFASLQSEWGECFEFANEWDFTLRRKSASLRLRHRIAMQRAAKERLLSEELISIVEVRIRHNAPHRTNIPIPELRFRTFHRKQDRNNQPPTQLPNPVATPHAFRHRLPPRHRLGGSCCEDGKDGSDCSRCRQREGHQDLFQGLALHLAQRDLGGSRKVSPEVSPSTLPKETSVASRNVSPKVWPSTWPKGTTLAVGRGYFQPTAKGKERATTPPTKVAFWRNYGPPQASSSKVLLPSRAKITPTRTLLSVPPRRPPHRRWTPLPAKKDSMTSQSLAVPAGVEALFGAISERLAALENRKNAKAQAAADAATKARAATTENGRNEERAGACAEGPCSGSAGLYAQVQRPCGRSDCQGPSHSSNVSPTPDTRIAATSERLRAWRESWPPSTAESMGKRRKSRQAEDVFDEEVDGDADEEEVEAEDAEGEGAVEEEEVVVEELEEEAPVEDAEVDAEVDDHANKVQEGDEVVGLHISESDG
ncbi:uncharacterized protein EV422DRAFT_510272 [Fimicolochytrium jonesii]|uniref:uncharacterized protein n=1 Tax=Fimicolochytrium jonesii TaxID=1396493 RepID=UPI0022FDDE6C|nr:uncharacterized protein EV422DRAFT_510272 [Fimicolochytrium jonesii]KAI8815813.1 hypothetical protein EV422DRAFT_510272 [Fimicolochytrium jonesii]